MSDTIEKWKQIPGFIGRYEVSDKGRIKNCKSGKLLNPFVRQGYYSVHFVVGGRIKNYVVHSLVMLAFVGERENKTVIHHKDFNKLNNHISNLEYCTQQHNRKQDFIHGIQSLRGEKNTQAKLTEAQVLSIVEERKAKKTKYRIMAEKYNVSMMGIANIFNGHTWSYLTGINK